MDVRTLRRYLDQPEAAAAWLGGLGIVDASRAQGNLRGIAAAGVTLDLLAVICAQIEQSLPGCADPDMALHNLERFAQAARNPLAVGTLFQRDRQALATLLQIFSASRHLGDLLVTDRESLDLLRLTEGEPVDRQTLVDELRSEIAALEHETVVLRALRRFKRRETLRIAYGDIVREQGLRAVTTQISFLADALIEAALFAGWRKFQALRGSPRGPDGRAARLVVLGLGKLGGLELNYSSDIDLIFLCDQEGRTDGPRPISNVEFCDLVAREVVRLLTAKTDLGGVYRVDMRLRPEGSRGPMVMGVRSALAYYDTRGRTWERQAYIKARPVAGDLSLGREFLEALTPWIYGRYLSHADISGIKALKRRIEQLSLAGGARNVKTGRGGIRDIEFAIQFLQLLNGGDLPEVRTGNTLEALGRLERVGCLTYLERSILEENYVFLRRIEHRLQIMLDLQTHVLPESDDELGKLALRMGYAVGQVANLPNNVGPVANQSNNAGQIGNWHHLPEGHAASLPGKRPIGNLPHVPSAKNALLGDYRRRTALNRKILDHLLHDAFSGDPQVQAEVDLVLDPDPPAERVESVLSKYRFRDAAQAYRNLMSLAEERIRFLSTRRCRHFLAAIAPELLATIAETADPDSTLVSLDKVSDSLGGKGVLWELFSFNPPSLRLYVELCAHSPYLSGILTSNPGMIDGLMDSLVLDKLPTRESMAQSLAELCRAAEDLDPILKSFKNDQQLCVGVRDILGKDDVQATTGALSDIAEVCLGRIADRELLHLAGRFGQPSSPPVIVALGKFGGRAMNYHSDLDIIFLYEADGQTKAEGAAAAKHATTNQHFFSELAQRIVTATSRPSGYGRLYEVDARLRPTGHSGALATSFDEFARYFDSGAGQLWERMALCKARIVYGPPAAAAAARGLLARAAFSRPWQPGDAATIRQMRQRLEQAAAAGDLKRGPGGIVDVEFLVEMLQLRHAAAHPPLQVSNTLAALAGLHRAGLVSQEDHDLFGGGYRLLRTIESRLRLISATARDTLPDDRVELSKLAHLSRYVSVPALLSDYETATQQIRRRFEEFFA